jgi:hypothetical protein
VTFRQVSPDVLDGRRGGGTVAVLGIPFLVGGSAILGWSLMRLFAVDAALLIWTLVIGLVLAGVGAVLVFGRAGVTIDKARGQMTKWYGLPAPVYTTRHALKHLQEIRVCREERGDSDSTHIVYPVRLEGPGGRVTITEPTDYQLSRRTGEQIARFLEAPMVDTTLGTEIRREPAELDESLRDRLIRTGADVAWPEPPEGMRPSYEVDGPNVVIRIPPSGLQPRHKLMFAVAIAVIAIIGAWGFVAVAITGGPWWKALDPPSSVVGAAFFLIVTVALLLAAVHDARRWVCIEATPRSLRVTTHGLNSGSQEIPADELEELQVVHPKIRLPGLLGLLFGRSQIVARSDRETISVSADLERDELDWISDAIRYVVTGAA